MQLMRSKAWEWSNPRFPTLTCPTKDEWRKTIERGIGVNAKESSLGLG